ncbi:MAG: antitoxin [Deltaproteobacteria bacterium RIFCSPHIGHO2_12_FULL_43_9]|nr:MAG: antitoxin [Deltaproteobacteria bacterium RIFCSPHIGHO2_12_FULL_43_9]
MRKSYDFSKSRRNPHIRLLKQQVTIRLEKGVIEYFKRLANETGVAYQVLINLYLKDCARSGKKPLFKWKTAG